MTHPLLSEKHVCYHRNVALRSVSLHHHYQFVYVYSSAAVLYIYTHSFYDFIKPVFTITAKSAV